MTYEEALAYIASLEPRGWRLGLDRMQAFLESAGLADSLGAPGGPQYIHVAGTNGKGSVTAFAQSMLVENGYRTGAFFSPYIVDPRERVQLGRETIGKEELAALTEELREIAERFTESEYGGITEFEFKTAVGFLYWKRKACEWVALEVGLGGRLDATNVVTPRACVIVSIGLDHVQILGDSLSQIATEKAGIVKPGVTVVVGDVPPEAFDAIERAAREREAPIWRFGREVSFENDPEGTFRIHTPVRTYHAIRAGLIGPVQRHNAALAAAALDAAGAVRATESIQRGAAHVQLPGRYQKAVYGGKSVVLDGAHNPAAAAVLRQSLLTELPELEGKKRIVLVTNMLSGHDAQAFYGPLLDLVRSAHVVPIHFHRAMPPESTAEALSAGLIPVQTHPSVEEGIQAAVQETAADELILVTGSNYLVGETLRATGLG